jgi:hypothetical protein
MYLCATGGEQPAGQRVLIVKILRTDLKSIILNGKRGLGVVLRKYSAPSYTLRTLEKLTVSIGFWDHELVVVVSLPSWNF